MFTIMATRDNETAEVCGLNFDTMDDADAWLDILSGSYWAEQSMTATRDHQNHTLTVSAIGTVQKVISVYEVREVA